MCARRLDDRATRPRALQDCGGPSNGPTVTYGYIECSSVAGKKNFGIPPSYTAGTAHYSYDGTTYTYISGCSQPALAPAPVDCQGYWAAGGCSAGCGWGTRSNTYVVQTSPAHGGAACPSSPSSESCYAGECPVNCAGYYSEGGCSASCGWGSKYNSWVTTQSPSGGGSACPSSHYVSCYAGECPVNCAGSYSWGSCSASCGAGTQVGSWVTTQAASGGGSACPAATTSQSCNNGECPVNCAGHWSVGGCSAGCGSGSQTVSWVITQQPRYGGTGCPADYTQSCYSACPVDCAGYWSATACSVACGGGTYDNNWVTTQNPRDGGAPCPASQIGLSCNPQACRCVGSYSSAPCSKDCGSGTQLVEFKPTYQDAGATCPQSYTQTCNDHPCPISCAFSYEPQGCSASCGGGTEVYKTVIVQQAMNGGAACPADYTINCNTQPCPVDCAGSHTTGPCNAACGQQGTQAMTWVTTTPQAHGGRSCPSDYTATCSGPPCPVDCQGHWQDEACSALCGGGQKTKRFIVTTAPAYGGAACPASPVVESCNTQCCPVDCQGHWGDRSQCTKNCGGGTYSQSWVTLVSPQCGGQECPSPSTISGDCNTQCCPVDCQGTWAVSECSTKCGGGKQSYIHNVQVQPVCGGAACPNSYVADCATNPCPIDCQESYVIGDCSKPCGGGVARATYTWHVAAQYGGRPCTTDHDISCNSFDCTAAPTVEPTPSPSSNPTLEPSALPTLHPSAHPSQHPSADPSSLPTLEPTPTPPPTPVPGNPTPIPSTGHPSPEPTHSPSHDPTPFPTPEPSALPTVTPTLVPTAHPSALPSTVPTTSPTFSPTTQPSEHPSAQPTVNPTLHPSSVPTEFPSALPTSTPTLQPTAHPTSNPVANPTIQPSLNPSSVPTMTPTLTPPPTPLPGEPTMQPTTASPSSLPTEAQTSDSTPQPTLEPSLQPSANPTLVPTSIPTQAPSNLPSLQPTLFPSSLPTLHPSLFPTLAVNFLLGDSNGGGGVSSSNETTSTPQITQLLVFFDSITAPVSVECAGPMISTGSRPPCQRSSCCVDPQCNPPYPYMCPPKTSPSPTSFPTPSANLHPALLLPSAILSTDSPLALNPQLPLKQTTNQGAGLTASPSMAPNPWPTLAPIDRPTPVPTIHHTDFLTPPSALPTPAPSPDPTVQAGHPTSNPSPRPTAPTPLPTTAPSPQPTTVTTLPPSATPTPAPVATLTTQAPSSASPTLSPTTSTAPTAVPTRRTTLPTAPPSSIPTWAPTTRRPTASPPTLDPTSKPTKLPSPAPSALPTHAPFLLWSSQPTAGTSLSQESVVIINGPTLDPSAVPTEKPTETVDQSSVTKSKQVKLENNLPHIIPVVVVTLLVVGLAVWMYLRSRRPKDKSAYEKWVDVYGTGNGHKGVNAPPLHQNHHNGRGHMGEGVEMGTFEDRAGLAPPPPPPPPNHPNMHDIYDDQQEDYAARLSMERVSLYNRNGGGGSGGGGGGVAGAFMTPQGYIVNPLMGQTVQSMRLGVDNGSGDEPRISSSFRRDSIPSAADIDSRLSTKLPTDIKLRLSSSFPPQADQSADSAGSRNSRRLSAAPAVVREALFDRISAMQNSMTRDIEQMQTRLSVNVKAEHEHERHDHDPETGTGSVTENTSAEAD